MGYVKVIPSPLISLSPVWSTSQGYCKGLVWVLVFVSTRSVESMALVTLLLPIDDVILLSRGDRQSVSCLFQQLLIFGKISSLSINDDKSSIYFGRVGERLKQVILEDIGFVEGNFPFWYLGVPLSPHRLLVNSLLFSRNWNQQFSIGWGNILVMLGVLSWSDRFFMAWCTFGWAFSHSRACYHTDSWHVPKFSMDRWYSEE